MAHKLNTLENLYAEQLGDLYSAEKQLIDALPKMAQAANSADLKRAFQEHLDVTRQQAQRLEQIFSRRNIHPDGTKCEGMEGLIKESEKFIRERDADPAVRDAALIAAAQRVEHYEISGYGTVQTYAITLEQMEDANLLGQTLQEEASTDERLTRIAESHINENAMR